MIRELQRQEVQPSGSTDIKHLCSDRTLMDRSWSQSSLITMQKGQLAAKALILDDQADLDRMTRSFR